MNIQRSDGKDNGNSVDIQVTGSMLGNLNGSDEDDFGQDIEEKVDSFLTSSSLNSIDGENLASEHIQTNNLKINFNGIYVSALNTVKDGRATATSNIIIEPVQIITDLPEASEKLK